MIKNLRNTFILICFIVCGILLASLVMTAAPSGVAFAMKPQSDVETAATEENKLTENTDSLTPSYNEAVTAYDEGQQLMSNASGEQNIINMNYVSQSSFTEMTLIPNSDYFVKNPKHGSNTQSDSSTGLCTTVAMQMLMGYHNYYSDRRIIPETISDGTRFLCENYGDLDYSPLLVEGQNAYNSLGIAEIGTEDAFYYELLDLTTSQSMIAVKNAANNFLVKYSSDVRDSINIRYETYSKSLAMSEIAVGRPTILGFEPVFSPATTWHVVVAYGYAKYNGTEGYIVHYGHYGNKTRIWVPESYFGYQITMEVNHRHDPKLLTENNYPGYYSATCSECGCKLLNKMYELDETGTITAVIYDIATSYIIPSEMYGQEVVAIGEGAFA